MCQFGPDAATQESIPIALWASGLAIRQTNMILWVCWSGKGLRILWQMTWHKGH